MNRDPLATSGPVTRPMPTRSESLHVLLFSTVFPPFIAEDERLLRRHFLVEKMIAAGPLAILKLPSAVRRNDVVLSWFGSVYAGFNTLLARLLGRISIIVIAGVDASKDREINYGIWLSPWKSLVMRYAFRHAHLLLVVDPFLGQEARRLAGYDGGNIAYLPFGFDPTEWAASESPPASKVPAPEGQGTLQVSSEGVPAKRDLQRRTGQAGPREPMVLTVASVENEWRMKKKGVDKLFAAARALPDVPFKLIGIHPGLLERIRGQIPANVEIIPYVPRAELACHYRRAKVYCQPSFTEGLPNTLCEALLAGCIPIGTAVGGIPTAVGDAGYLVDYRDQPGLLRALRQALAAPESDGQKAAGRIKTLFTVKRREDGLREAIESLASRRGKEHP